MIGRTIVVTLFSLAIGAVIAGAPGAFTGLVLGLPAGLSWDLLAWLGTVNETEHARLEDRVICIPFGGVAAVTLVRDVGRRRWVDVERCSLLADPNHVTCEKNCLKLMNDAA